MPRYLEKTLVQREVVTNRVLPSLFIFSIIWKMLHYVLIDAVKSKSLFGTVSNCHHDKGVVTEGWLFVFLLLFRVLGVDRRDG